MLKKTKNQKGMAVIEMIPIMIIIVLLVNFSIGFFGIVHTGNLNAIAARNYTFETLRHRSHVHYHRMNDIYYTNIGNRFSGIVSEKQGDQNAWFASARRLSWVSFFGGTTNTGVELNREPAGENQNQTHNLNVLGLADGGVRNENVEVYNVWIRSLYGICLNSRCGD